MGFLGSVQRTHAALEHLGCTFDVRAVRRPDGRPHTEVRVLLAGEEVGFGAAREGRKAVAAACIVAVMELKAWGALDAS